MNEFESLMLVQVREETLANPRFNVHNDRSSDEKRCSLTRVVQNKRVVLLAEQFRFIEG